MKIIVIIFKLNAFTKYLALCATLTNLKQSINSYLIKLIIKQP